MATKQVTESKWFGGWTRTSEASHHKAVLEEHSEYFKKALNGSWKEADDKVVCLDDVDLATFEVFASWLYTGKLPIGLSEWNRAKSDGSDQWYATARLNMIKACVFAHRMIVPKLYKALEHCIIDEYIGFTSPLLYATVIYAFGHLPPTSPVLRAMIDVHCYRTQEHARDILVRNLEFQLPRAFLLGVMFKLTELNQEMAVKLANYKCFPDVVDVLEAKREECGRAWSKKKASNFDSPEIDAPDSESNDWNGEVRGLW